MINLFNNHFLYLLFPAPKNFNYTISYFCFLLQYQLLHEILLLKLLSPSEVNLQIYFPKYLHLLLSFYFFLNQPQPQFFQCLDYYLLHYLTKKGLVTQDHRQQVQAYSESCLLQEEFVIKVNYQQVILQVKMRDHQEQKLVKIVNFYSQVVM